MGVSFLKVYTCIASIKKIYSNLTVLQSLFKILNSSVTNTILVLCGKLTFVVNIYENCGQRLSVKKCLPESVINCYFFSVMLK